MDGQTDARTSAPISQQASLSLTAHSLTAHSLTAHSQSHYDVMKAVRPTDLPSTLRIMNLTSVGVGGRSRVHWNRTNEVVHA